MKTNAIHYVLMLVALTVLSVSCNKSDENNKAPEVELISGEGLISADAEIPAGATMRFKVHALWNGDHPITNMIVVRNQERVLDESMNREEFERIVSFVKSTAEKDTVIITVRDIKGKSAQTSVVITKSTNPAGDELVRYSALELQAQEAQNAHGFLSLNNGSTYTLDEAYVKQAEIGMLYYYDASKDKNTLSSPGANISSSIFPGEHGLANWNVKNTTRFHKIASLTEAQFDTLSNSAYVSTLYSEADGKRKAKKLKKGDTYSFKVEETGKYGVLLITNIEGKEKGAVTFSLVIQM